MPTPNLKTEIDTIVDHHSGPCLKAILEPYGDVDPLLYAQVADSLLKAYREGLKAAQTVFTKALRPV